MIAVISDIHGNLGALEAVLQDLDWLDLAGLPFLWRLPHQAGDLVIVHATPWSIADVVPPDAPEPLITRVFTDAAAPAVVVYGHIHIAYVREAAGKVLVNPGSVGLPFDGDQRASYAVLDVDGGRWQATCGGWPTRWLESWRLPGGVQIRTVSASAGGLNVLLEARSQKIA